ncbi:MAG: SUMF1/EgtB/PvdO family nonheme iron enzyme [Phycisphaerae bacterium]
MSVAVAVGTGTCAAKADRVARGQVPRYLPLAEGLTKCSENPVLDVGAPGQWDDGRTGCFTVSKVGKEFYLWYMGSGEANPWRIGLATSPDGVRWKRCDSNPVLGPGAPGTWDDRQVSMPYVLKDGERFCMWYSGAGRGGGFGLATSPDGVTWTRHGSGPVMRGIGASCDPCVRKTDGGFQMWYCGRIGKSYRICRASSPDGVRWQKVPDPALPLGRKGSFDELHQAGPCVLRVGEQLFMWYLGSDGKKWCMGLATSKDGVRWERSSASPILDVGPKGAWDSGSILGHDVLLIDDTFHVWYAAVSRADMGKQESRQTIRIGYARSGPPGSQAHGKDRRPSTPPPAVSPLTPDQAGAIQKRWAKHLGKEAVQTNSIGMGMVLIPPGEFTMGRTEEQFDKTLTLFRNDEKLKKNCLGMATWSMLFMPAHRVRITRPFYMGACEVTVAQFRRFAEASGYKTEAERGLNHGRPIEAGRPVSTWQGPNAGRKARYEQKGDEPVLHLCWNDCVAFCEWLGKTEGEEYCLPTEAEWEYACRAGTTTRWHFGDLADCDRVAHEYAWMSHGPGDRKDRPRAVGLGKPNGFGLYDMHGNVWEYVADWWHRLYYKESPINDPTGPAAMSEKMDQRRIIRGGSYDWPRWGAESAYRMRITQRSNQHPHMGFRVAMRIKRVEGVPPAVDPDEQRRQKRRDPGPSPVGPAAKARHPRELTINLGDGVTMGFVLIRPGSFLMGSESGPKDERPVHRVVISRPYYMAKIEVTQEQWEAVIGKDPRLAEWSESKDDLAGPKKAMNGLSWNACQDFIRKLEKRVPGHSFALPTEAQWEYACRAGSTTEYSFGGDASVLGEHAWCSANKEWPRVVGSSRSYRYYDAGTKKPNAWGLHDMHGGMWEWCADWYDEDYYLASPLRDPTGPETGRFRVLRGGSWFRYGKYARSAYRRFFHPESDSDAVTAWILDFGCRIVILLPEGSS